MISVADRVPDSPPVMKRSYHLPSIVLFGLLSVNAPCLDGLKDEVGPGPEDQFGAGGPPGGGEFCERLDGYARRCGAPFDRRMCEEGVRQCGGGDIETLNRALDCLEQAGCDFESGAASACTDVVDGICDDAAFGVGDGDDDYRDPDDHGEDIGPGMGPNVRGTWSSDCMGGLDGEFEGVVDREGYFRGKVRPDGFNEDFPLYGEIDERGELSSTFETEPGAPGCSWTGVLRPTEGGFEGCGSFECTGDDACGGTWHTPGGVCN